jgi:hypothetical protein
VKLREVVHRVKAAHAAQTRNDIFGDGPFVKGSCAGLSDRLKRAGKQRLTVHGTRTRRLAVYQHVTPARFVQQQQLRLMRPVRSRTRCDCITVLRQLDGRCEQFRERQRTVIARQCGPRIHGARHRYRMRRMALDSRHAQRTKRLHAGRCRRPARTVEADDVVAAAPRIKREAVTAYPR